MADNNLINEKDVPSNWEPVESSTSKGSAPAPYDMPPLFSGSISPTLQHDVSFVGTKMGSPRVPKNSLMPFGAQANAFTNSATKSVIINTAAAAPAAIDTDTTDGLIHGDAIWESDSAYIFLRDDFAMPSVAGGGLSNFTSELAWAAIGAPFSVINGAFGQPPYLGSVFLTNNSTASFSNFLTPFVSFGAQPMMGWALLDYPGWKLTWVFGVGRLFPSAIPTAYSNTKTSFYIGMANYASLGSAFGTGTSPRPQNFLGLRYDTDPTSPAISDTTYKFEYKAFKGDQTNARHNDQGTVFDTGLVPTEGKVYRLEISCTTAGVVNFLLTDGTTVVTNAMTVTQLTISDICQLSSNGTVARLDTGGTNAAPPWAPGSKVTISSIAAPFDAYNGTITMMQGIFGATHDTVAWYSTIAAGSSGSVTSTIGLYPALAPFVSFGNDTQAGPVTGRNGVWIDYFSFIWNPALGGGGTPNPLLARYF